MDTPLRLYGADYSCYTRIARLALAEAGLAPAVETVDIFAEPGGPAWYRAIHPFGRIPALVHGDLALIETSAITRYVASLAPEAGLVPAEGGRRARMDELIAVLDAYGYRALVWDLYVEVVAKPERGGTTDPERVADGLARAAPCLARLAWRLGDGPCLAGETPSLADLHAYPMLAYARFAPPARDLIAAHPALEAWMDRMEGRASVQATRYPRETG